MNNLTNIEQWLFQKHIKVNPEWLGACLEFITDQLPNMSINELKDAVYKQWITEDLCLMGCQSLPPKINSIHRIVLTGKYILQINSLRDISQPAYSQLVTLKGNTGLDNVNVSAAPTEPEPAWKTKPKRMLYIEITDGRQELRAMEYKPIPALTLDTTPGSKLLVCGPVECRLGVLLLSMHNVQVLGGEVETLAAANTQEQVLNRAIGDRYVLTTVGPNRATTNNTTQQQNTRAALTNRNADSDSGMAPPTNASTLTAQPLTSRMPAPISSTNPAHSSSSLSNRTSNSRLFGESHFGNQRQPMGQKRLFSDTNDDDGFEDFEDDQDPFESIDFDELDRLSQGEPQQQQQVHSNVNSSLDNFDFEAAEMQLEEEMDNLDTFTEGVTVTSTSNSSKQLNSGPPATFRRDSNTSLPSDVGNIDWSVPYCYLSSLSPSAFSSNRATAKHVIIQGFVSTVTSQLKPHPNLGWQLTAKVNDGSASLDVMLAHSLLVELIGYSVEQVRDIRFLSNKKPELQQKISKSVNHCQDVLRSWTGLMEIILVSPVPCLLKLLPTQPKHLKLLCDRVASAAGHNGGQ